MSLLKSGQTRMSTPPIKQTVAVFRGTLSTSDVRKAHDPTSAPQAGQRRLPAARGDGVGLDPRRGHAARTELVERLVIQEQLGSWVMYRLDAEGGFVGDTWHPTREDAPQAGAN